MHTKPKLSIAIPTYKRIKKLQNCINSFLEEAIKYGVEICVSDNNSEDGTKEYLSVLASEYENVKFIVQEKNIGPDLNMLSSIKISTGEYCLWLGDDDMLEPDAISTIFRYLQTNPDLLVLKLIKRWNLKSCYDNPYDFFYDYGIPGHHGAMHFSSLVVKVDDVKKLNNLERYDGSLHLYAGAVLDYLISSYKEKKSIQIKVTEENCVLLDQGNKDWNDKIFEIFFEIIPNMIKQFPCEYIENPKCQKAISEYYNMIDNLNFLPHAYLTGFLNKKWGLSKKNNFKLINDIYNFEKIVLHPFFTIKEIYRRPVYLLELLGLKKKKKIIKY